MFRATEWSCQAGVTTQDCAVLCDATDGCVSFTFRGSGGRCCLGYDNLATDPSAYCCGGNCAEYEYYEVRDLDAYGCKCTGDYMGDTCETQKVYGCIDATARNYLLTANVDDGNCEAVVVGCMLSFAFNYNPAANTQLGEDGGCVAMVEGCTSTYAICENNPDGSIDTGCFDPDANTDDGSCVINRCDDIMQAACDANALCFPLLSGGSECVCLPNWKGDGTRCVPEIKGCTVGPTCNATDTSVSADVSSCAAVDVEGAAVAAKQACTAVGVCAFHPGAVNYDASADTDEEPSTCYYNPCDIGTDSCPAEATCVFTGPDASACQCATGFFWEDRTSVV
jgi:hypothetical protein